MPVNKRNDWGGVVNKCFFSDDGAIPLYILTHQHCNYTQYGPTNQNLQFGPVRGLINSEILRQTSRRLKLIKNMHIDIFY